MPLNLVSLSHCHISQIILRLQKRTPLQQQQHDRDDENNHQDSTNHQQVPPNFPSGHHTNEEQIRLRSTYARKQQNYIYAHLKSILKPLPLQTPTIIDLSPEKRIRVTLFDANHCIGAVCFLIEDLGGVGTAADGLCAHGDGNAIFYTGDIRAEKWWVDALTRHPILVPYTTTPDEFGKEKESDQNGYDSHSQPIRRLSTLYLDTSYATRPSHVAPYLKPDVHDKTNSLSSFPSKRAGLSELLTKVARYPPNTLFYFRAWTFGYEEVWIALAAALNTKIHVDGYWKSVYYGLRGNRSGSSGNDGPKSRGVVGVDVNRNVERKTGRIGNINVSQLGVNNEYYDHCTAALVGFHEGNRFHDGCLIGSNKFDHANGDEDDYNNGAGNGAGSGKSMARILSRVHSCQRATPATGPTAATNPNAEHYTRDDICPVAAAVSGTQYRSGSDDVIHTVNSRRRTVGGARVIEIIPVVCRRADTSGSDRDGRSDWDMFEVGAGWGFGDEDTKDVGDRDGDNAAEGSNSLPDQIVSDDSSRLSLHTSLLKEG